MSRDDPEWEISHELWHKMKQYHTYEESTKASGLAEILKHKESAEPTGLIKALTKLNENRQNVSEKV